MNSEGKQTTLQPQPNQPQYIPKFKKFKKFKVNPKANKANNDKQQPKQPNQPNQQQPILIQYTNPTPTPNTVEELHKLQSSIRNMIETRTRYYVDQRIGVIYNSNMLYTRGTNSLNIDEDAMHGGKSLVYKNNGNAVITMTDTGYIYCKNIMLNGLNIYNILNSIYNDMNNGASIYVKHTDLKNGLYDMNINSSIMKYLKIMPNSDNVLEVFKDNNNAMVMNTDRTLGYAMFKPNMSNGETIYGLRFGKDNNTGANIRYTYSTTDANSYLALGAIGSSDTLNIYKDRRVIINCNNNQSALFCKYDGTLSNNQYNDVCIGDDAFTVIFRQHGDHSLRIGMKNNSNNVYGTIRMYRTNIGIRDMEFFTMFSTKTSGSGIYVVMKNVAEGNPVNIAVGKTGILDNSAVFGYVHSNSNPLGYMALFNEPIVITFDKNGNMNMNGLTCSGSVSCAGLYSSAAATIDGLVTCTQLDVANTTKNTWYAKLRVEDYLSNNEYIRMIFKDLGGQANIDLFHDSQYYGLRLQVPTANANDNKLCIYPTGVTIDGDLDCYNDVSIWENLEVAKDISISNTSYGLKTNNISSYSGGTVTVNSNIYIDNTNQLQTDILNSAFDNQIRCLSNMEITNEDNDAVLASDNIVVYDKLQVDAVDINSVATSADVNDNTKINDNTIATTAYIRNLNNDTSIHQEIPNNPYASVAITDNPYLLWRVCSIGSYNTNTNAVCYSEELHQFVIVGNNGRTYFSYDGVTWMNNSMNAYTWTGVTYGPTYGYIACTSSNMYLIQSTDGRTWVPYNNVSPSTGRAIAYGNEYYAIVPDGTYASYLAYTTNPTVSTGWGSFWLGSTGKWYNIAYSKKQHKFVVVGASGKYVSFDDEFTSDSRVTGQLTENTKDCHSVCYSDKLNLWIIAVNDSSYCYVSTDGNTFYQHALPYQTSWHRVIWGNDRFIMTTSGSSSAAYSLDGTSWYPFDVSTFGAYSSWLGLTYGNGLFILSGNNNTAPLNTLIATYTLPNSYITPRAMMLSIYPIGSIYISMVNINPGAIFGGSWTEIQNKFLYAVPTTSTSNDTGGEASHTHKYGFRYGSGYGCMKGLNNTDYVNIYDDGIWKTAVIVGSTSIKYDNNNPNIVPAAHLIEASGNVSTHSSMPPYVTVYAWYRYA